jgi:hypothetical protein
MAGLIARLFGGRSRPPDPDPLPGVGGYRMPRGQTGAGGYPGSTALRRTFGGRNPRTVGLRADTNTGWESGLSSTPQVRQSSYRGDERGAALTGPRSTPVVVTQQPTIAEQMQATPATFYGGPLLRTGPGNNTAGANPLGPAQRAGGHSKRDTETPPTQRQPMIGLNVPGAQNVRNQIAQRYKAVPGQSHTYQSASRPDQAPVGRRGQNGDGSVKPEQVSSPVTVQSRFVFNGGGNQTWYMLREMPYGGRGDGARGAQLSGLRYYATGQADQFWNAGQGDYGIARARGGKRPVSFTMPAPWSANYYDTTESVGTSEAPGAATQAPDLVYVSPSAGRASNSTGRTG